MKKEEKAPLTIALIYAVIGASWIYFTDKLLPRYAGTASEYTLWSTYKGWLYVAVTSALLYWLIWRYMKILLSAREALEEENRVCITAQAALKESEEQFHHMFSKHGAIMYLFDPETLSIFDANEAAQKFYGYSGDEFKKLKVSDLNTLPEEELRNLVALGMSTGHDHHIFRHRLASGEIRDVEVYSTPIRMTNRQFFFAIIYDITDRRQIENALRESEARFRSLVEATSDWIWEIDARDIYTYASPKVMDFLGYTPQEVIGKTPFDFMPVNEAQKIKASLQTIKSAAKPFTGLENRNIHKNGAIVVLESSGIPFFDAEGQLAGYRGIDRDITERKHLEEQLLHVQKMEAVGELAGGIAHDFNNILTAIMGYVYILQSRIDNELLKKHVDQIGSSAERAAGLVNKLLAFSRKKVIYLQPVKIGDTMKRSQKLLSRLISENIEIREDHTNEDLTVQGDEVQIEQVLMNLVTNARDAMASGGVLTIHSERVILGKEFIDKHGYGKPGAYALISVSDTGIGMDEKTRERIFDPFFTTKEVDKGTGLGLAIVYGIIKQHHGYIEVSSAPGKGATFSIYLPLIEAVPAETGSATAPPSGGKEGPP